MQTTSLLQPKDLTCLFLQQQIQNASFMSENQHNYNQHWPSASQIAFLGSNSAPPAPPLQFTTSTPQAVNMPSAICFTASNQIQIPSFVATSTRTTECGMAIDLDNISATFLETQAWQTSWWTG